MYEEFLKDYQIIKQANKNNLFQKTQKKVKETINKHIVSILGGTLTETENDLYFNFSNKKIPISAAASSIKELAPFLIAVTKYRPDLLSVLFEEPESHLHPQMQIELTKLMAFLLNNNCFFQITTHSDIILAQFNNLIRLNTIYKQNKNIAKGIFNKLNLSADYCLSQDKISSYLFTKLPDGKTNIVKQNIEDGISLDSFEKAISELHVETMFIDENL
jgi:predicted ATP-dependent endonuclease of OLD family